MDFLRVNCCASESQAVIVAWRCSEGYITDLDDTILDLVLRCTLYEGREFIPIEALIRGFLRVNHDINLAVVVRCDNLSILVYKGQIHVRDRASTSLLSQSLLSRE